MGHFMPWAVAAGGLAVVGNGLLTTLSTTTSTAKWVGFQIVIGASRGMGVQMPVIAIQTCLPEEHVAIATAVLVLAQYLGSAVYLSASNTLFSTSLTDKLAKAAPSMNAGLIIASGATAFRARVPETLLPAILKAYVESIGLTFYIALGLGVLAFGTA
ncbi:unnamed protein product [Discula destructiva]